MSTDAKPANHVQKLGFKTIPIVQNKKKAQTFIIEGMDCGVCAQTLEKYLTLQRELILASKALI